MQNPAEEVRRGFSTRRGTPAQKNSTSPERIYEGRQTSGCRFDLQLWLQSAYFSIGIIGWQCRKLCTFSTKFSTNGNLWSKTKHQLCEMQCTRTTGYGQEPLCGGHREPLKFPTSVAFHFSTAYQNERPTSDRLGSSKVGRVHRTALICSSRSLGQPYPVQSLLSQSRGMVERRTDGLVNNP